MSRLTDLVERQLSAEVAASEHLELAADLLTCTSDRDRQVALIHSLLGIGLELRAARLAYDIENTPHA